MLPNSTHFILYIGGVSMIGKFIMRRSLFSAVLFCVAALATTSCMNNHDNNSTKNEPDSGIVEVIVTEEESVADSITFNYSVPAAVAPLLDSCEWYVDTLCVVKGKAYCLARDRYDRIEAIYEGHNLLVEQPSISVSLIDPNRPNRYLVSTPYMHVVVDFSKQEDVQRQSDLTKTDSDYFPFRNDTHVDSAISMLHGFRVDFPKGKDDKDNLIRKWLVSKINRSLIDNTLMDDSISLTMENERILLEDCEYKGRADNYKAIAAFSAERLFSIRREEYLNDNTGYLSTVYFNIDYRIIKSTNHFVTYLCYTHDYNNGAHGYFTERLLSYDFVNDTEIDWNYLFKPGSEKAVNHLFYETVQEHPVFGEFQDTESVSVIQEYFERNEKKMHNGYLIMPQPGLTDEGVVFSYQPDEASCFAAGVLHFVIPYSKLLPFFTDQAIDILGLTPL